LFQGSPGLLHRCKNCRPDGGRRLRRDERDLFPVPCSKAEEPDSELEASVDGLESGMLDGVVLDGWCAVEPSKVLEQATDPLVENTSSREEM
jgi:hypothetical protein